MPCFKGLAVSIHTPDGPLPEHAVQKTSRLARISTYIPVPPPKIPADLTSTKPEPSTFAISITLLTPNQDVPYSTPKPTAQNPHPQPRKVGALPGHNGSGKVQALAGPYVPLTTSPNETIAAYIYFDGRAKEEVATLLRKGEETWVNSRWVSVPESEGGGLAEREFLFREVGLERWLNGLDLEGKDAAATIEKRRQKLEKRRRKRKEKVGSDDESRSGTKAGRRKSTLRYGDNGELQDVSDDDEGSLSDTQSSDDDDDPMPEAAGQIKVALFRVLASGEIKRGEYSPQFDAHDDDEDEKNGNGETKDIDHTTSFAKPKTLDPKTISTQTVTGIDPTDKPYAVFTFLYRGQRQLQKMGILAAPSSEKTPTAAKRRSVAADLPSLGPLKKEGTLGFSAFRDTENSKATRKSKKKDADEMDSDSDDDEDSAVKMEDMDDIEAKRDAGLLSPDDAERAGQVAEGIRKMKLKRQHSAEPLNANGNTEARKSSKSGSPSNASTPYDGTAASNSGDTTSADTSDVKKQDDIGMMASPLKKHRSSMAEFDDGLKARLGGSGLAQASNNISEVLGTTPDGTKTQASPPAGGLHFGGALLKKTVEDDDEEL